ncbi:MAG TPA: aldo/keto reductase [bacterium]|nr:aldo/keto reductase [bacterium]HOL35781.1 aldo/keto reductase [bacterium]HPP08893.1 aldo/keto reductase [bacterium]
MTKIPKRNLGKTRESISIIGFGGLALAYITQKEADRLVQQAIESGVNFFDVAPSYGDAEIKLGNALKGIRSKILLSCKTTCRRKMDSWNEMQQSLKRLRVDYFDFYLMHGIRDMEKDVIPSLSKDGMLATAVEARKSGLVKFIGFSAHTEETAIAALNHFDFDVMAFPVNAFCYLANGFAKNTIMTAMKKEVGIIGLKALAKQKLQEKHDKKFPGCWYEPVTEKELAKIMLLWTYQQGVSSIIPPADAGLFKMALEIVKETQIASLAPEEIKKLESLSKVLNPIFP